MITRLKDHMIEAKLLKDERLTRLGFLVLGGVIILLISDVVYLNSIIFQLREIKKDTASITPTTTTDISALSSPTQTPSLTAINTPVITQIQKIYNQNPAAGTAKDYFIPLGTGSTASNTWQTIDGAITTVDLGGYTNIDSARFEVSISNPTSDQSVWARLYDSTDSHEVWNSEVTMNGNTSKYLVSGPISWQSGTKQYQVQMKTQLQSSAVLTQSRIHVIIK